MKQAGLFTDKLLFSLSNKEVQCSPPNFTAVYLLTEIYKNKSDPNYISPYQEYLDIMPSDAKDFPVNYTDEELALLKGSVMMNNINIRK